MNNILQDDWGFYVDIENVTQNNNYNNLNSHNEYKKNKDLEKYYKDICDEYEYNVANYDSNLPESSINKCDKKNGNITGFFIRVTSTTIITALLTYFVFFIL